MSPNRTRYRTGDPQIDERLTELLDALDVRENRDQLMEILTSVALLADDESDRLNLKITNSALKEMRLAFKVFEPYTDVPKVTIFGSARTLPDDPLYAQARNLATVLAGEGWMVVTGAGPGIMAAGVEGAGVERSIGINIRLPFEQEPTPLLATDPKLVDMKYFFTRKLMLMKESAGFAVLPGGFGTLDEAFELLTLLQTGKAAPAPVVLLDVPGGTYWKSWGRFVTDELATRGVIDPDDHSFYLITDNVEAASAEIRGFYRNYHSIRYVGDTLVIRIRRAPAPARLEQLNEEFADICIKGGIEVTDPLPAEVSGDDRLDLERVKLAFDKHHYGRLRQLIDALNALD
ncbi:MAG: LOG family protein [Actinobacteria bacterium]|nr:MAG: LOG family protein [Actinomycetota bacterium]